MNAEAMAVLKTKEDQAVPLVGVRANGRLDGLLFELTVEQHYRNQGHTNIEAVYTFPVPLHAAFLGLEIEIGARHLIARAKRTDQARRDYEEAIDEGNTAVLLEQADDGLYTVSLGNLLANESAVIRYRYAELLDVVQGAARLRIPTVIAPRYGDPGRRVQPHQVPGEDLAADYPFELAVTIEGLLAAVPLSSPTHAIRTTHAGTTAVITLTDAACLDRDFVLSAELGAFKGASVTARDESGGESEPGGFVSLVSWVPALPAPEDAPLALKVLIDCSGSMGGDSIAQARRALAAIVDRIEAHSAAARLSPAPGAAVGCGGRVELRPPGSRGIRDSIGLTRFGSTVVPVTNGLQAATPELLSRLRSVAANLDADLGGTELPAALRDVVSQPANGAANPAVLLITDGEIWAIDQALAEVAAAGHRLFVVAVGAAPNEALARRVAEVTGGACEFVTPGEDIERAIVNMARRVREPLFRVSDVRWPVTPRWTAPLPSAVFSGDTVHLLAAFDEQPEGIAIVSVADRGGETMAMQPVAVSSILSGGDALARVAASRRLAVMRSDEAAELAERYQLASQWTALIVVDEREVKSAGLPELATVPQMLAAGWGGAGSVHRSMPPMTYASIDSRPEIFDACPSAVPAPCRKRDARAATSLKPRSPKRRRPERAEEQTLSLTVSQKAMPRGAPTRRPMEVAEQIVAQVGSGRGIPALPESLATIGVPIEIVAEILTIADSLGLTVEDASHLFAAMLVDRLRSNLADAAAIDRDEFHQFMSVLGERRWRRARQAFAQMLSTCSADVWQGEH